MIEIARTRRTSTASPASFFARWCDLETHPEWAPSMEYFRLDEPFRLGARGVLKAVGGDEARFRVTQVGPGFVYADATELDGAELEVCHSAVSDGSGSVVELSAFVGGPREAEWAHRFGQDVQRSLERDLASLATILEA